MKLKNGTIVLKQGSRDPGPGQGQVRSGSLRSRFKPRVRMEGESEKEGASAWGLRSLFAEIKKWGESTMGTMGL